MDSFTPATFHIVDSPQELKAFTDPLRTRILAILARRAATNQKLADLLGEPPAKVLYHLRVLLDVGLIRLIHTQVKGGNVEKYYRAIAFEFGLRPGTSFGLASVGAQLEQVREEATASASLWPDQPVQFDTRARPLAAERAAEFYDRLLALVDEYWGDRREAGELADTGAADAAAGSQERPLLRLAVAMYRSPLDTARADETTRAS